MPPRSASACKIGLVHDGIELSFGGRRYRIDFRTLTGKAVTVYGQTEVTKDLIGARLAAGGEIVFEAEDVSIHDFDGVRPRIRFRKGGKAKELRCDFIGGCDGFHGVCRVSVPEHALTIHERVYPRLASILAETPPVSPELIYCHHVRGFALFSMRSPALSRLYIQCAPDEHLDEWPDERIWDELRLRLGGDAAAALRSAPASKSVTPMRSFVAQPMRFGRLFLAGDAAHIVPPTGAKGLNLAAADVHVLARALTAFYASGGTDLLEAYSGHPGLRRVWRAQRFSWWMTSMLPPPAATRSTTRCSSPSSTTSPAPTPHRPRWPRTTSACRSTESARSAHRGADHVSWQPSARPAHGHCSATSAGRKRAQHIHQNCRDRASSFLLSAWNAAALRPFSLIIGSSPTGKHPCWRQSTTADRRQIHGVQDSRGTRRPGRHTPGTGVHEHAHGQARAPGAVGDAARAGPGAAAFLG